MNLFIGADPEFVVYDKNGKLTSATTILPENGKNNRIALKNNACMFYDNVQLEVNVSPATSAEELINNFRSLFYEVSRKIGSYTFAPQASATFPEDQLKHPDAKVFGCDPEFCAYKLEPIQAPTSKDGFRSAGGHIHLGQEKGETPLNIPMGPDSDSSDRDAGRFSVIRMMDLIVGLPGVILDKDPTSCARRKLYGAPGSHRVKPYGAEYRSMGNFWLAKPSLVSLIFSLSYQAVQSVVDGKYRELYPDDTDLSKCKYPVNDVIETIKTANQEKAKILVEKWVKPLISSDLYLELLTACNDDKTVSFYNAWGI